MVDVPLFCNAWYIEPCETTFVIPAAVLDLATTPSQLVASQLLAILGDAGSDRPHSCAARGVRGARARDRSGPSTATQVCTDDDWSLFFRAFVNDRVMSVCWPALCSKMIKRGGRGAHSTDLSALSVSGVAHGRSPWAATV
ncbi:hypothetical protein WA026_009358 [Henosepilachna vigintioctopunctata]|uniref:Uncharacterized protein n=1 Tax=Henosepilachna vigintioctopunctata TaxID=420089 RepID=A0AAW1U3P3_9CUCU